jgi:hypothetical protein
MLCRVATVVGAVGGWGVAVAVAVLEMFGKVDHDRMGAPMLLLSLSAALICSACLALRRHQRPLGAAYELGYDQGRRDAIRDATKRSNVSPIRRVERGLSEFSRKAGSPA